MPNVKIEILKLKHEANDLKDRFNNLFYEDNRSKRYMDFQIAQAIWIKKRLAVIEVQLTLLGVKV